jgi:hypothetical protein
MTDTEKLAIAMEALTQIRNGSGITGRWIDQNTFEAIDGSDNPDEAPNGYYDLDNPPKEDDTDAPGEPPDADAALAVNGQWLTPAMWEAYTGEEQDQWLASVADIAAQALTRLASE